MVKRLVGPKRISASELSREVGVSQPTLSRWKQRARTLPAMSDSKGKSEKKAKSSRQWSAAEKLQVVVDAAQLSDEELGSFLRSRGLHTSQLEEWRLLAMDAAQQARFSPPCVRVVPASVDRRTEGTRSRLGLDWAQSVAAPEGCGAPPWGGDLSTSCPGAMER
jgi:transposase-like protein